MKVAIADSPEHEYLFAEISLEVKNVHVCWARILYDRDSKRFKLHIFPELLVSYLGESILDLVEVQEALEKAKTSLINYGGYGEEQEG